VGGFTKRKLQSDPQGRIDNECLANLAVRAIASTRRRIAALAKAQVRHAAAGQKISGEIRIKRLQAPSMRMAEKQYG